MSWRGVTDRLKRSDLALRIADRLGRGRGRLRVLDDFTPVPIAPHHPNLRDFHNAELAAVWIGHATVLLRVGGLTILTDPVFSTRVGLGLLLATAGPARLVQPAVALQELPPIDVILLSHSHFDHLDRPTLARLSKKAHVVCMWGMADLIDDLHFRRRTELRWNEQLTIGRLNITALPVEHWGARTFLDKHRGYGSFLLEDGCRRVLFGGDTAYHEGWKHLRDVDLAILGLGAYDPYIAAHSTPEQALTLANDSNAKHILPMHHSTFVLSHEPVSDPMHRLMAAARSAGDADRIVVRKIGQMWKI